MIIRNFKITDYDEVYALWMRTPDMGLNDVDDSREGIARYLARNPRTSFVAEASGEIIGAIMCGHDGRRGHIHHTCVDGRFRRSGIGASLVTAALDALKEENISKAMLVVFASNEGGNAFWERMGFTTRPDLDYRNRALVKLEQINT